MASQKFNPLSGGFDLVLDQASEIKYTPSGNLLSTNAQDAIDELETQVLNLPNPITYRGVWNATTNTPILANTDTGKEGYLYQVTVGGTHDFGAGPITFDVNDKVVNDGTVWNKWDQTDAVTSVNGLVGDVLLTTTEIPEGTNLYYTTTRFDTQLATKTTTNLAEGTNLYFTDERAQDAVGAALTDTTTIDLTYNDVGNTITADVVADSLTNTHISATANIDASKLGTGVVSTTEFNYLDGVTSSIQAQLDAKVPGQAGDIFPTSFSAAISGTAANITGAAFAGTVRSFVMEMDIVGATSYQHLTIKGIQKASDWVISQSATGDSPGIAVSITSAGQLQYISNETLTLKFRAATTPV